MTDQDIGYQAEAFFGYFAKHMEMVFVEAFEEWAGPKDFDPEDQIEIWARAWIIHRKEEGGSR